MSRFEGGRGAATLLALFATSFATGAVAQDDVFTPWHVATMEGVVSAEISPGGDHVAFVKAIPREPRKDENGGSRLELHVLDYGTGTSRAFVTAKSGVSSVHWMPDGEHITFLAKRDGDDHRSLYAISVRGGEARRMVALSDRSIGAYEVAPDGQSVAILAREPQSKQEKADKKDGFNAEIYEEDWKPSELWIALPFDEDAEPRHLPLDAHLSGLAFSPDGSRLAVAAAPTALVDDSYMEKRVWVVDVTSGDVVSKIENEGKLGSFAWKPDGSGLALIAAVDVHDGAANRLLWAPLGAASVTPVEMLAERERDEHQAHWLPDGRLLVRGSQSVWSTLDAYRVDGASASAGEAIVPVEGPVWTSLSVSREGTRAALVGSSPNHMSELYTLNVRTGDLTRRTDSNPWFADMRMGTQEVVRYAARDGVEVEGVLIRPTSASGPVPLIVCVHGGPEAHLSNGWLTRYSYPGQIAAAKGYAVFYPNYRGSTGRGLAYLKLSQGDPAGKEFDDVVDGVDYLIAEGIADPERVGVTGGSYGGYATGWFSTYYSDRFAAGVMFVGISNKISKVGTTDIANEEFYVHAMKRPWDDWQFFLERSPIYYADRGKTPLLILHGKEDTRVDPGQSRELYRHLKLRGQAPVRLVNYPGEGHGNRKAGARFDYNLRLMRWFDHYLKGDGGDAPEHPLDYDAHLPQDEDPSDGA